jgi:hypothetical protein
MQVKYRELYWLFKEEVPSSFIISYLFSSSKAMQLNQA